MTAAELAGRLQVVADELVENYVEHCRMHGYTWSDIGSVLGVSRQAAQQRFVAPHQEYSGFRVQPVQNQRQGCGQLSSAQLWGERR